MEQGHETVYDKKVVKDIHTGEERIIVVRETEKNGNGSGLWKWLCGILITALGGVTMTMLVAFTKPSEARVRDMISDTVPWPQDKPKVEAFMMRTDRELLKIEADQKKLAQTVNRIDGKLDMILRKVE